MPPSRWISVAISSSDARLPHAVRADDGDEARPALKPREHVLAPDHGGIDDGVELARQLGRRGSTSSEGSWRRIASCRRRTPQQLDADLLDQGVAVRGNRPPRPSAWRPQRSSARASAGRRAVARSGLAASSASISPTSSWWRPVARSASIASSAAVRRSSSSRRSRRSRTARRRYRRADHRDSASAARAELPVPPRAPASADQPLKDGVHLVAVDVQLVGAPVRDDRDTAAQPRHVVLDHLGGAGRRILAPQAFDQPVHRAASQASRPSIARTARCLAPQGQRAVIEARLDIPSTRICMGLINPVTSLAERIDGRSTGWSTRPVYGMR